MIERWSLGPCFVLRRADDLSEPWNVDYDAHFGDELDAQRGLRAIVETYGVDEPTGRIIVRRLERVCLKLVCDNCQDDYEHPESGGSTHWSDTGVIADVCNGLEGEWRVRAHDGHALCPDCLEKVAGTSAEEFDIPGQAALLGTVGDDGQVAL